MVTPVDAAITDSSANLLRFTPFLRVEAHFFGRFKLISTLVDFQERFAVPSCAIVREQSHCGDMANHAGVGNVN